MTLYGHIDVVSGTRIAGWAWDSTTPDTPVALVLSVDRRVIARCLADTYRPDVAAAGFGHGRSGFDHRLAEPLSPLGAHEIQLRREGDGTHLVGSPRVLAATTTLDPATRHAIDHLVGAIDPAMATEAMAFFALQTERLRTAAERLQDDSASAARLPRALVIDDRVPAVGHDAGSEAILSHMRALQRLGFDVTFVPATLRGDPAPLAALGIPTCLFPLYASVEDVLRRKAGAFQLVYIHRMANAGCYVGLARRYQASAILVYSVADLHFLRSARQAQVEARPELAALSERQRNVEYGAAVQCNRVITHSTFEADLMRRQLPSSRIDVVPWAVRPEPTREPFAGRRGVAFIGNYDHQANADGARFLLERIMPEVWAHDPTFPCLLVGSNLPDWLRALTSAPAEALGLVPDLATVFDRVRLSVAPLAFGAGIKGKVLTSMAAGVPCVCTPISAEGLNLPAPLDALIADDVDALAAMILRLDQDATFNAQCAAIGLDYVTTRLSEAVIDDALRAVLSG